MPVTLLPHAASGNSLVRAAAVLSGQEFPMPPVLTHVGYDGETTINVAWSSGVAPHFLIGLFQGGDLVKASPLIPTGAMNGSLITDAPLTGLGYQVAVSPSDSGEVDGWGGKAAVLTARAAGVTAHYNLRSVTASWTMQGAVPADLRLTVTLFDADGKQGEQQVSDTSAVFQTPKPLRGDARLEFQVKNDVSAGPLVVVPLASVATPEATGVSYETDGGARIEVTVNGPAPSGLVPAVTLLREGVPVSTKHGQGTQVTVQLAEPLATDVPWAISLAWAAGDLSGPASEPLELITAPPAISDARADANKAITMNWEAQPGPPWATAGWARLAMLMGDIRPGQAVTYPPAAFIPDPELTEGELYALGVSSMRGPVRGPISRAVLLPNFQTPLQSTSYDGETVTVTWIRAFPLNGITGCLVEVLSQGLVIAAERGGDGHGSVRVALDPAGGYTARLRWLSGTVTGPPGPEKPVIAATGRVTAASANLLDEYGNVTIDITIAPSAPLPAGTAFAPYLMQGERVLIAYPAVTSATTTIGYKVPDMSGLTLRVRATVDGCTGPLGPPAPALVTAPVITRAALRGTTLDLSWTLPPDVAGAVSTTQIKIGDNHWYPRLAGTRATVGVGGSVDSQGKCLVIAYAGGADDSANPNFLSPPSQAVPLLTAAPAITKASFDGQTVSAWWSWTGTPPAPGALATGYRLELFAGTTLAGQAVVSGPAGRVTLDRPFDPAVPLRLAVSPLAGVAEYTADPGPALISAPPVLTEATENFDSVLLAWHAAPDPGSVITGYEAVFSAPGPAGGTAEVVSLGPTSPAQIGIPSAFDPLTPTQVAVRAVGTAGGAAVTGPSTAPVRLQRRLPDLPLTIEAMVTTDGWLRLNWLPTLGDPEGYDVKVTTDGIVRQQRVVGTTIRMFLDGKSHRDAEVTIQARRGVAATSVDRRVLILSPPEVTEVDWDGSVLTAVWKVLTDTTADVLAYELTVRNGDVVVGTSLLDHLVTATGTYTTSLALPPASAGLAVRVAGLRPGSRGVDSPPVSVPAPGPAPASVTIDPVTGKATVTWAAVRPAPTIGYLVQRYSAGLPDGDPVTVTAGTSHELTVAPVAYDDLEVAIAVRTTVGTATVTGPFGPRLRVPTEPARIRDVDFDGRTVSVSWAPVPGATGYALTVTDGHAPVGSGTAAGDQTAKRFAVALGDPGLDYRVTVQPLRGASSGVRSTTAPLVGDGLYVLPGPARIVRARTAQVTPQPVLAYLPDLTATGQPLTGLPIAPPQAGETLPPFTLEQAPSNAAPMKYRLRIENGALSFGSTRGALADAYRKLLSTAETNGATPRGILALQQAVARLMPQTLDETLYYSYGLSRGGSVDLRPGMVLRVAFSTFDLTAVSGAPPWSSGYAGGTVLDYEIGDYAGAAGSWLVGFDAFVDWLVARGALTVPAPQTPAAPTAGGTTQSGGADAADLSYPLFSQPFYRLLVPSTLQDAAKPVNSWTNQQFTIAAAAKWQEIDAATAAPGGGVHVAYFRGRAVLRACIRVEVDGAEHVVPVGTTVGNLLDRVARRPPWASLALRGVRLYRAPGSSVLPGLAVFDPAAGYDAAAMSRVRLDWPGSTAWPAGPQDALSLPLLHGDRLVFGKDT